MKYIFRRITTLIVTLILVSGVTFLAFNVMPADPALIILGTEATPQKLQTLRTELGLNESLPKRYLNWTGDFTKGDFGKSIRFSQPVKDLISSRLPVTLSLTIMSMFLIIIISIPLGVFSAKKEGTVIDTVINIISQLNMAIPSFFLGIILILVFGLTLKLFSPGKYVDYNKDFIGFLGYLITPAFAIALSKIAAVVKFLRASVLQEMSKDYVRTAYSKGNRENAVLYKHILKNSLVTIFTLMGIIIADILANSIIIEQLFGIPGIGRLIVMSISTRDFPLIEALVILVAFTVVFINFFIDVLYQVIDPRIRIK